MGESLYRDLFEAGAFILVVFAMLTGVLRLERRPRWVQGAVLTAVILLECVPFGGLRASQYFLTIAGHLSITSLCLMAAFLLRIYSGKSILARYEKTLLLLAILISGIGLYLATFGVIGIDIYQFGYGSAGFFAVLAAIAIASALARFRIVFWTLIFAALAFQLHLLRSDNFWDYLVDPILFLYAVGWLIVAGYSIRLRRRKINA